MKRMRDKTVLITGASRGIGKALAQAFKERGAIVYGTGTSPASIAWMESVGLRGRVVDVAQVDQVKALIKTVAEECGKIDCLINNAGIIAHTPASKVDSEEIDRLLDVNLKGCLWASQAYYQSHRKTGGVIVNIASVAGMYSVKASAAYCATKGALIQLTRSLANEWARHGFRVNALCPGMISTDMNSEGRTELDAMIDRSVPLKRWGNPEELVGPAIFLASDASSYVTGQTLVVDGGMTCKLPF
jgi:3-oxoacyl-[acyl-carrier protein] reductase